jgi:hypothetical protein
MVVQDSIMPLDLAPVAVHRIGRLLGHCMLEMNGLSGVGRDPGGDEEEPGEQFRPVGGRAYEAPCLVAEIKEDGAGIEYPRLLTAGPLGVDDCRHLAVGIDRAEARLVLLAFARVDRHHLIGNSAILAGLGVGWK